MPTEGQIADGPNGPLVYRGGRWYPVQQTQQPPVDPAFQYAGPKAAADVQKTQTEIRNESVDARVNEATLPAQIREANAKAQQAELEVARLQAEIDQGGLSPAQRTERTDRISRLNQLVRQINRVQELYLAGPGQTSGLSAIQDYFPTEANTKLDVAGAQLSQQGLAAFRVPGTGTVSDRDAAMFDRGNLPQASTFDAANEEIIRGLKARVEEEMSALGLPNPKWGSSAQREDDAPTGALNLIRTQSGGTPGEALGLADSSSTQFRRVDDPVLARAHDDLVQTLLAQGGGRLDPDAYAAGVARLAQEQGYQDNVPPEARAEWARAVNDYLASGGRTVPTELTAQELMSAAEIGANNLVNNPLGAALSGAANTASFGLTEALAPGQYAALGDAQPGSQLVGEIGGAVAGTSALGAVGRNTVGRAVPALLQGGGRGQFLRNVAADATYGGAFGGITEGDPLTGAAFGAGGSTIGQGLGRGLGAAVGGAQRSAAAQALRDRGVPISVGRQLGLGRAEDLASSIPFVGDAVRARQLDSFTGLDRAAIEQAGAPIGFSPTQIGEAGADDLLRAAGNARSSVMDGRTIPLDSEFLAQVSSAVDTGIPANMTAPVEELLGTRLNRIIQDDALTGDNYAIAMSNLKANRANPSDIFKDYTPEFRQSVTNAMDSVTGLIQRSGNDEVIQNLNRANTAYRDAKIIQDATNRAKVGTGSGAVDVFTGAQLKQAAAAAKNRGFGRSGLTDLANDAQEVLPSTVPNSGTADRALFAGLLGGAGVAGTGVGAANDPSLQGAAQGGVGGVGTTAGAITLASLLGTRRGQQVLEQILITRPQVAQRVGQGIRRRGGLFGSSGSAVALNQQ